MISRKGYELFYSRQGSINQFEVLSKNLRYSESVSDIIFLVKKFDFWLLRAAFLFPSFVSYVHERNFPCFVYNLIQIVLNNVIVDAIPYWCACGPEIYNLKNLVTKNGSSAI